MSESTLYNIAADTILILHVLFIAFVVFGLALILAGMARNWRWTRNLWFRVSHLAAILVVVGQSWFGIICPLTIWENRLRVLAGSDSYSGSFIQHWLHELIFFQAESWIFSLTYTLFAIAVVLAWWLAPPRTRR